MELPSLDNSLPHLDDIEELLNSLWDEKPIREVNEDKLTEIHQWLLDGAPTGMHEESDKVAIKKDCDDIPKVEQKLKGSPMNKSDAVQKDQVAYSSVMLTPDRSPLMSWHDNSEIPTVVPVPNFISSPAAMTPPNSSQTQLITNDRQVYEINGVAVSVKNIAEDIQRNCHGVVQNIKIEPLHELQPVQQACLKPAPSQVVYELPNEVILAQSSSCMYAAPSHSTPPYAENLETQQVPDFLTIAVPSTGSSGYEPISPFDAAEPAPELTGELTFDWDTVEHSLAYNLPSTSYAQVPPSTFCNQAATHPAQAAPTVQDIDPAESYVEVPSGYVLPAAGNSIVYPVQEIYIVDALQSTANEKPIARKKPRKAQIAYDSGLSCNICGQQFGKQGSLQQHVRQKHQEDRPFRCDICGKSYLTEQDMVDHRVNHDPSMKRYKCQSCDNRYRHMKDRDRHFETHHGKPTHPCEIEGCPKAFARHDHMRAHLRSHENRNRREKEKARLREEKENNRKQRGRKPREERRVTLG